MRQSNEQKTRDETRGCTTNEISNPSGEPLDILGTEIHEESAHKNLSIYQKQKIQLDKDDNQDNRSIKKSRSNIDLVVPTQSLL